jgi:hypothetical protein
MTAEKALPLWTPAFALLCCAQFFGSAQHALLQPTFPLFITSLGGKPLEVGFVLACFAVTSVVFRPLIGGWADRWSEPRVLTCGLRRSGSVGRISLDVSRDRRWHRRRRPAVDHRQPRPPEIAAITSWFNGHITKALRLPRL